MNVINKIQNIVKANGFPDFFTIVWILINLYVVFNNSFYYGKYFDYIIWGFIFINSIYFFLKNGFKQNKYLPPFVVLICIQTFGFFLEPSFQAVRHIIASMVVYMMMLLIVNKKNEIQLAYLAIPYSLMLITIFVESYIGINDVNTTSGLVVILTLSMLYFLFIKMQIYNRGHRIFASVLACLYFCLTIYIVLLNDSRDALMLLIFFVIFYLLFKLLSKDYQIMEFAFIIIIALSFLFILVYMNIKSMPFYNFLDYLSNLWFGKNLDSGRPNLWSYSLNQMSYFDILIGKGTGVLPTGDKYAGMSYHNMYITIFVQNGFIGITAFIYLLYYFWKNGRKINDLRFLVYYFAVFSGIIVYNIFETTLIQNKVVLGLSEWIFIGVPFLDFKKINIQKENNYD